MQIGVCSGSLYHSEFGDDVGYYHSSDRSKLIRAAVDRVDHPMVGERRCSVVVQILVFRTLLSGSGLVVVWTFRSGAPGRCRIRPGRCSLLYACHLIE